MLPFSFSLIIVPLRKFFLRGRLWPEGTDVHDPKGSQKNFMQGNFGLILRFLFFQKNKERKFLRNLWQSKCLWSAVIASDLWSRSVVNSGLEQSGNVLPRAFSSVAHRFRPGWLSPITPNPLIGNFPVTPTNPTTFSKVLPYKWEAYCRTNGSHTAVQMGGVLLGFPFFKA